MSDPETTAAIAAALKSDWETALEINLKIHKENPLDTECMNRLGKAYLELGNNKKAITIFKEVLKINKYDPIATKNLLRANQAPVSKNGQGKVSKKPATDSSNISFLEEPGRTKMVTLVNVAPIRTLLTLQCTDLVALTMKRHSLLVENMDGTYLGALPDDLGHRLLVLIKGGNEYEAIVKSVGKGLLILFIREKLRAKRFKNTPSFPSGTTDYLSFVRDENSHEETPNTNTAGTEEGADDEDESVFKKTEHLHQDEMPEEN